MNKEDIIIIECINCQKELKVNKMLWYEGKIFQCDFCGLKRLKKMYKVGRPRLIESEDDELLIKMKNEIADGSIQNIIKDNELFLNQNSKRYENFGIDVTPELRQEWLQHLEEMKGLKSKIEEFKKSFILTLNNKKYRFLKEILIISNKNPSLLYYKYVSAKVYRNDNNEFVGVTIPPAIINMYEVLKHNLNGLSKEGTEIITIIYSQKRINIKLYNLKTTKDKVKVFDTLKYYFKTLDNWCDKIEVQRCLLNK